MLTVESRPGKGRCVVATKNIPSGTLLFVEKPFASVLNEANHETRCSCCFRSAADGAQLQRCSSCRYVRYCRVECQKRDWGTHRGECQMLKSSQPCLPPHLCRLVARLLTAKARSSTADSRETSEDPLMRTVEDLVTHHTDLNIERHVELTQLLLFLRKYLQEPLTQDLENLRRLLYILNMNCFTVLDEHMKSIGIGLYLKASNINHSCQPSAFVAYNGSTMRLVSNCPLSPGDEVTVSYIELLVDQSSRQCQLKDMYYFTCACPKCSKLVEADGALVLPDIVPATLQKCVELESIDDFDGIIQECKSLLDRLPRPLDLSPEAVSACISKGFDAAVMKQDWSSAIQFAFYCRDAFRLHYGVHHPCTGYLQYEIGKILLLEDHLEAGIRCLEDAHTVLCKSHGEDHFLVVELHWTLLAATAELKYLDSLIR